MSDLFAMSSLAPDLEHPQGYADPMSLQPSTFSLQNIAGAVPDLFSGRSAEVAGGKYQDMVYTQIGNNLEERLAQSYDNIISRVKNATGVALENPLRGGYAQEIDQLRRAEPRISASPFGLDAMDTPEQLAARREAFFRQKLKDLSYPKSGNAVIGDLSAELDAEQKRIAAGAELASRDAELRPGENPISNFLAASAGEIAGQAHSPMFWGGMVAGVLFPGSVGSSVLARVGSAALIGGGSNAALTAAEQPLAQAGRAAGGLTSGTDVAIENIKNSFLYGAVGAGALQGLGEAAGALFRNARPSPAGSAAAEAERGGAVSHAASDLTLRPPPGVSPDSASLTFAEALDHASQPGSPFPLAARLAPEGATDDLALAAVDGARDAIDMAERLRADPRLVASSLASDDPHLRMAGHVAALGDGAYAMARNGDITPEQAAIVAMASDDPLTQTAMVGDIRAAGARSVGETRALLSDRAAAANARSASLSIMGAEPFGPSIRVTPDNWLDGLRQAETLGNGEITGALSHPDLGEIVAPWKVPGDPNHGISGLIARGRRDVVEHLPAIISDGKLTKDGTRAFIETADHKVVVRLDWTDDPTTPALDKRWVLTAFEKSNVLKKDGARRVGRSTLVPDSRPMDPSSTAPRDIPIAKNVDKKKAGPRDMIPVPREDGSIAMIPRDQIAAEGARDLDFSQIVASCKD